MNKKRVKYGQVFDGDWIRPYPQEGHKMACCDCGLVHTMDFRIVTVNDGTGGKEYAVFRAVRDNRATAQRRRRKKHIAQVSSDPQPARVGREP